MINLFCGYDFREAVGFHVFVASVLASASEPVAIKRLDDKSGPVGSNAFTYSRFLVPELMGFKGHAIFADACDMLMREDIAQLDALYDSRYAVQVVKHRYTTCNPIKYRGTEMQCPNRDYPRKNWASLMLINCEHPAWRQMEGFSGLDLLQFKFIESCEIGELPDKWNRLVDEGQPVDGGALLHWTAGIPALPVYVGAPGAAIWHAYHDGMLNVSD